MSSHHVASSVASSMYDYDDSSDDSYDDEDGAEYKMPSMGSIPTVAPGRESRLPPPTEGDESTLSSALTGGDDATTMTTTSMLEVTGPPTVAARSPTSQGVSAMESSGTSLEFTVHRPFLPPQDNNERYHASADTFPTSNVVHSSSGGGPHRAPQRHRSKVEPRSVVPAPYMPYEEDILVDGRIATSPGGAGGRHGDGESGGAAGTSNANIRQGEGLKPYLQYDTGSDEDPVADDEVDIHVDPKDIDDDGVYHEYEYVEDDAEAGIRSGRPLLLARGSTDTIPMTNTRNVTGNSQDGDHPRSVQSIVTSSSGGTTTSSLTETTGGDTTNTDRAVAMAAGLKAQDQREKAEDPVVAEGGGEDDEPVSDDEDQGVLMYSSTMEEPPDDLEELFASAQGKSKPRESSAMDSNERDSSEDQDQQRKQVADAATGAAALASTGSATNDADRTGENQPELSTTGDSTTQVSSTARDITIDDDKEDIDNEDDDDTGGNAVAGAVILTSAVAARNTGGPTDEPSESAASSSSPTTTTGKTNERQGTQVKAGKNTNDTVSSQRTSGKSDKNDGAEGKTADATTLRSVGQSDTVEDGSQSARRQTLDSDQNMSGSEDIEGEGESRTDAAAAGGIALASVAVSRQDATADAAAEGGASVASTDQNMTTEDEDISADPSSSIQGADDTLGDNDEETYNNEKGMAAAAATSSAAVPVASKAAARDSTPAEDSIHVSSSEEPGPSGALKATSGGTPLDPVASSFPEAPPEQDQEVPSVDASGGCFESKDAAATVLASSAATRSPTDDKEMEDVPPTIESVKSVDVQAKDHQGSVSDPANAGRMPMQNDDIEKGTGQDTPPVQVLHATQKSQYDDRDIDNNETKPTTWLIRGILVAVVIAVVVLSATLIPRQQDDKILSTIAPTPVMPVIPTAPPPPSSPTSDSEPSTLPSQSSSVTLMPSASGSNVMPVPTSPPEPEPTGLPSFSPTTPPIPVPTGLPTISPTAPPVPVPTELPTFLPTTAPAPAPTELPTLSPTVSASAEMPLMTPSPISDSPVPVTLAPSAIPQTSQPVLLIPTIVPVTESPVSNTGVPSIPLTDSFHATAIFAGREGEQFGTIVSLDVDGNFMAVLNHASSELLQAFRYRDTSGQGIETWNALPSLPVTVVDGSPLSVSGADISVAESTSGNSIVALSTIYGFEVFELLDKNVNGTAWIKRGQSMQWESPISGNEVVVNSPSIAFSADGSSLAAAFVNGVRNTVVVRMFHFEESTQSWIQMGDVVTQSQFEMLPLFIAVSLSLSGDGTVFALGSWTDDNPPVAVEAYQFDGTNWNPIGGQVNLDSGPVSLALSQSGHRLALAGPMPEIGAVYEFNISTQSWDIVGNEFMGGTSISINDAGTRVVVGDGSTNLATVYDNIDSGSSWVPISSLTGNPRTRFGESVSMAGNGNIIAISAPEENFGEGSLGRVAIFE
jgi:hypothetical protein